LGVRKETIYKVGPDLPSPGSECYPSDTSVKNVSLDVNARVNSSSGNTTVILFSPTGGFVNGTSYHIGFNFLNKNEFTQRKIRICDTAGNQFGSVFSFEQSIYNEKNEYSFCFYCSKSFLALRIELEGISQKLDKKMESIGFSNIVCERVTNIFKNRTVVGFEIVYKDFANIKQFSNKEYLEEGSIYDNFGGFYEHNDILINQTPIKQTHSLQTLTSWTPSQTTTTRQWKNGGFIETRGLETTDDIFVEFLGIGDWKFIEYITYKYIV